MQFVKAHTNGNDFVIVEGVSKECEVSVRQLSDRHFGVGCDQVVFFARIGENEYSTEFFNADGSQASMCCNGLSALALVLNKQHNNINEFLFKTGNIPSVADVSDVNVCLRFQSDVLSEELVTISHNFVAKLVAVGNYHLIIDVDSGVAESDEGEICKEYDFANIHFVQEKGAEMIVRTWERGVGWTSSCGSGAVACGYCYRKSLKIISSGGESSVQYDAGCVKLLTTPKITFSGIIRDLK